jgi:diguanylate cyclase (GGDEF)-like protein
MVVRFGGDEFVILLNDTEESIGGRIAERIRAVIAQNPHSIGDGKEINVTVSVGWTTMTPDSKISSAQQLLHIADASLYAAKPAEGTRSPRLKKWCQARISLFKNSVRKVSPNCV